MKFYNRENEIGLLRKAAAASSQRSVFTVITGRRRVGKTALALEASKNHKTLYFFVSKKEEPLLCEEFTDKIKERLKIPVLGEFKSFEKVFELIMEAGKLENFTLILDEFQELGKINPSIYSSIQKIWDINKDKSFVHLTACGSIYSLMKNIFEDSKEPLFGRADFKIDLKPFKPSVLKSMLAEKGRLTPLNFLDFFIITGGIAKYTELCILHDALDLSAMLDLIFGINSIMIDEGKNRLIEEFGKDYGTYFSILALISSSKTSRGEIESILGKNVSGYLYRLEHDYSIIKAVKPFNAVKGSKNQKFMIDDNFLNFWFRFVYKYQSIVEAENFDALKSIALRDFNTYRGRFLEKLFIEIFKESGKYTRIGSYWEKANKNEIDIVLINDLEKKISFCEVKLDAKRFNKTDLAAKALKLRQEFHEYTAEYLYLSLNDLIKQ
jgi:AAA+ ATPase superfamily predicted ATPase